MGGRLLKRWPAFLLTLSLALMLAAPAQAAFPGQNGKIAFNSGGNIWVMNSDGSNPVNITNDEENPGWSDPQWSPDGTRIATTFFDNFNSSYIETMNPDGTGRVGLSTSLVDQNPDWSPDGNRLVLNYEYDPPTFRGIRTMNADGTDVQPAGDGWNATWSPDGTRIAFIRPPGPAPCPGCWGIYTSNPDGSGVTEVYVASGSLTHPDWSPDGRKLVFSNATEIYTINVDGTGLDQLTSNTVQDVNPGWSPDGTKILYVSAGPPGGIWVMDADGSNSTFVRFGHESDWQPIPVNSYPRPKGASPMEVSLVPAYEQCTSPNRTHGPPLAFGSCSSPTQASNQLTVGSPDANGQPAKSVSSIRINPLRGDPSTPADEADVRLRANINDVRLRSDLSDYSGALEVRLTLQITDKDNTPHPGGPGAATVQGFTHSHPLPCAPTANTTVGSTCAFDTTVEALVPGAVKELTRAIWALGAIRVHDGAGNLFLTQGIFVP